MTIYVGNLSYQASEQDLNALFSEYGDVSSVNIISDKFTGRSKGFAFVDMDDDDAANSAIDALNDTEYMQRKLVVNQARPRTERPPRRGGSGGGGGYNRDRGGYNNDRY